MSAPADRELLELAAKAAGIGPVLCYETRRNCLRIGTRDKYELWRPLTDDGDALRLAVNLAIYPTQVGLTVEVFLNRPPAINAWHHVEPHNGDPYAATRRAIVRAAAEIGRKP